MAIYFRGFVTTFHGQASFAWNWAMLRCQCRIVDLAERALRYAEHRWGPHSEALEIVIL